MIDHLIISCVVGLVVGGLFCHVVFDVLLGPFLSRHSWQANRKRCPSCGARTSASRLAAPAPLPTARQDLPPPAPLPHQS
jgi:hypothetical protein